MISYLRDHWAVVIIAMGGLYALFAFGAAPAIEERNDLLAEQAVAQLDLAALVEPEGSVSRSEVATSVARLIGRRFGQEGLLGEQDRIHDLASEAGLRVENLDPDSNVSDEVYGSLLLQTRRVRVTAAGSYDQIAAFLSLLDAAPMAVVERYTLGDAEGPRTMELSVTIQTASVEQTRSRIADGGTE